MACEPVTVAVAAAGDNIARAVKAACEARGGRVRIVDAGTLARRQLTLAADAVRLEGQRITGILWRVPPDSCCFSLDFRSEDQIFADTETRAIWFAALHSHAIVTPFKPTAEAFFHGAGWQIWREALGAAGVRVAALSYGATPPTGVWLPYNQANTLPRPNAQAAAWLGAPVARCEILARHLFVQRTLVAAGTEPASDNLKAAVNTLRKAGLSFGEIGMDCSDSVVAVDPIPVVGSAELAHDAGNALAEFFHADRNCWRS